MELKNQTPIILKDAEKEITNLLSDLIRIDTTNPPGNETQAATYIANYLSKEGFKTEIIESASRKRKRTCKT